MSAHPLLRLAATQPHLLADHVGAYAGLVNEELSKSISEWKRNLALNAIALGLLVVSAVLAGVALMLWAVIPAPNIHSLWALIAAPAVPGAIALLCLLAGRSHAGFAFAEVKQQLAADLSMLREVSIVNGPS